jgi:hypothetical protein
MPYGEIIAVCFEIRTKHTTLFGQDLDFLNSKRGMCSNRWAWGEYIQEAGGKYTVMDLLVNICYVAVIYSGKFRFKTSQHANCKNKISSFLHVSSPNKMFIMNVCGIDNPLPLLMAKRMAMGVVVGVTMVWHCCSLCVGLAQCLLPSCVYMGSARARLLLIRVWDRMLYHEKARNGWHRSAAVFWHIATARSAVCADN